MQQILSFFVRNRTFFVFLLLLIFSLGFLIQSNYYRQSKWLNSANAISGGVYQWTSSVAGYFDLVRQNRELARENKELHQQLLEEKNRGVDLRGVMGFRENYQVRLARVVKNSIARSKNYLTIDVGDNQGVKQDMAVISPRGVVGIVETVSANYATVQSVLNTLSSLNVKPKNSGHFGSLRWNTRRLNRVQVEDIPKIAPLRVGDTIVTGGMSNIFPKDIPVGRVVSFSTKPDNTYQIEVELFTDMSSLEYVYIIENKQKEEIEQLQLKF